MGHAVGVVCGPRRFLVLVTKKDRFIVAASFAVFAFLLYVPAGYYMEVFMFRRRQRNKAQGRPK